MEDRSLHERIDVEFAGDLAGGGLGAGVTCGGRVRRHSEAAGAHQLARQNLGNTIGEKGLTGVLTEVLEGKYRDGPDGGRGRARLPRRQPQRSGKEEHDGRHRRNQGQRAALYFRAGRPAGLCVGLRVSPGVDLGLEGVDRGPRRSRETMDRHATRALPPHHRAHIALQVVGDLLPGAQHLLPGGRVASFAGAVISERHACLCTSRSGRRGGPSHRQEHSAVAVPFHCSLSVVRSLPHRSDPLRSARVMCDAVPTP